MAWILPHARRRPLFRLAAALCLLGWLLLVVRPPAARADCSALDVGCTVEETVGTVEGAVDGTTGTVEGVVKDPVGTVEGAVDGTTGTVERVVKDPVGTIKETVDDPVGTIGDSTEVIDQTGDAGGTLPAPTPPVATGTGQDGTGDRRQASGPADGRGEGWPAVRDPRSATAADAAVAGGTGDATTSRTGPRGIPAGGGFDVGTLATTLTFPALLAIIVAAFVAVQNRLDRRDPKLAIAPIGRDIVRFT